MEKKRATLIGLAAIVLWSTMVGLIRGVSEGLGPVGGAAMIYSLSGLLLIFTVGFPQIRQILAPIYWQGACCSSAMKFAWRCRSD
jgi:drug/metabolite transporter (DMT)-like permease